MAYSSLREEAQVIKICDLCQEEKIKWRCLDCDMCFCEKCKTFHLRVPATALHQILTITTPLEDVQRGILINNIPCKDHKTKVMCLYCETCRCLVCPECISSSHSKHHFIPITTALEEKQDQMKSLKTKITGNLDLCKSKNKKAETLGPKCNAILNDSIIKIKQREKELKESISKYSKYLTDQVESQRLKVNTKFSKIEQETDNAIQELDDQRVTLETILTSNQGQVYFEADIKLSDQELVPFPDEIEQFSPGKDSKKQIQELFGSLQRTLIKQDLEFEVIQSFTTDLQKINKIQVVDESSIWISDFSKKVIRKSSINSRHLIPFMEISFQAYDITLTSDNDILLTDYNSSEVKFLTKLGEIKTFLSVAPLRQKGVHVTEDNYVIVGFGEFTIDPFTITVASQRALAVYNMDGKKKHGYEYDKNHQRMFTIPIRIRTIYKKNIVVTDRSEAHRGRVVTLTMKGDLKWVYEGHSLINAETQFNPRDLETATGYILVSDISSNAIHVLSDNGDILACQVIDQIGIQKPVALDIYKGQLWIGCFSENEANDSKIHIAKIL